MKRKLIWQGNGSATVTLPASWIRGRGLQNGEEIDIVPSGEHLIIGMKQPAAKKSISLHLESGLGTTVKKLLATLYRSGYDEIAFHFTDPELLPHIQQMVWREMFGFEIASIEKNKVLIQDIAELDPETFPVLFKKSFLSLLAFVREITHHIAEKNRQALEEAMQQDVEINKMTNLCLRLLSKKMNDRKKIAILTYMLRTMEKLADSYRDLATCVLKTKPPRESAICTLQALTANLEKVYGQYYRFELNTTLFLNSSIRQIYKDIAHQEGHGGICRYFYSITQKVETLCGGPLVLNIEGGEHVKKEDWVQ